MRLARVVFLSTFVPAAVSADDRRTVPVYTNEDLERVSPRRGDTGVLSEPAFRPGPPAPPSGPRPRGEEYWRREAQRVRDRIEPLRRRADGLRARIEERRRRPQVRPYSDPRIEAWQTELKAVEDRIREHESRIEERARREGALPGWLR